MKLLIKEEFWNDLYKKLNSVKKEIMMQFMTFEGDKTGLELANKLIKLRKKGIKISVLIDFYTNYWVSDTFYLNKKVRKEARRTQQMIKEMKKSGIKIIRTRPYGFLGRCFLSRNHKKIIIIDNLAYLGGINISDHNREWFDFMIKINNEKMVDIIKKDFKNSQKGIIKNISENDVYTNKKLEELYYQLINKSKKEIIISSPYILDYSLIKLLKNIKVNKTIYTLGKNNLLIINLMSKYLINKLLKYKVKIFFYKEFSHAKFVLIDKKYLLIGSSNFGIESFLTKEEIGILITDKKFIKEFYKKMVNEKMLKKCYNKKNSLFSFLITFITYNLFLFYAKVVSKRGRIIEK